MLYCDPRDLHRQSRSGSRVQNKKRKLKPKDIVYCGIFLFSRCVSVYKKEKDMVIKTGINKWLYHFLFNLYSLPNKSCKVPGFGEH
ncbi:protein ripply2 isoform X3 [Sminthopsis crassicaudata]|uniref:protein ripply2 isoform X3 n=1 Tax=Sminthopsis crassicaudata TaxID=9301 RepID=UPI003D6989B4